MLYKLITCEMRDARCEMRPALNVPNAEFFDILQGLVDLDPTFAGMTNKISKIQGIWLMVSVHLAHLLACLIHPFSFIRLAVERL